MARKMKTSDWLRWIHFVFGVSISGYFMLMPAEGWSDGVNSAYKFGIVGIVFWTGVARWNLPRFRRWRAMRARQA